ncbi:hypothetical protein HT585_24135 [Ensifer sp. HO-A22]|uniref:Uncharacterized protein n=1 Tax=Ensifer oleiphilus TaxID=2742698 RepID=A0A7Y6QAE0_9HYPH|nr:hypothetical protein [Ensifer oleiphilus]NVD41961.1 hypothetical protein [Ensifer oleiphilus]
MTLSYGVVVPIEPTGELAAQDVLRRLYPHAAADERDFIWLRWRAAPFFELVAT